MNDQLQRPSLGRATFASLAAGNPRRRLAMGQIVEFASSSFGGFLTVEGVKWLMIFGLCRIDSCKWIEETISTMRVAPVDYGFTVDSLW